MTGFKCPCCGASGPAVGDPSHLLEAGMSPREKIILRALVERYPRPTNTHTLINALYGNSPSGGAEQADHVVWTMISALRKTLPKHGWTIPKLKGGSGNVGHYRLVRI